MTLALRYAVRSDVGLLREGNQDSAYAGPHLLAVADGLEGHAAGEVASAAAITTLAPLDGEDPGADLVGALADAVATVNLRLQELIISDPAIEGMGTTLTALLWSEGYAALCHIGDSRAYLLRDGQFIQATHDHTVVQEMVDEGKISEDDVATHPERRRLLRALDGKTIAEPDLAPIETFAGDRFLLCSVGLSGVLTEQTLHQTLASVRDPDRVALRLVELALKGGGPDNITCVVADVVDARSTQFPPTRQPVFAGAAFAGALTVPRPSAAPRSPAARAMRLSRTAPPQVPQEPATGVWPAAPPGDRARAGSSRDDAAVIEVAIRHGGTPGTFGVEIVSSPAGEASASVTLDVDDLLARRERLQWAVLASAVASRRVLPETERPVQEMGKLLFAALLGTGAVAGRYRAAAAVAAERGQRLRVVLRIDTPTLAALPWEAMYDEAAGAYLCRQDQLVRHIGVASVPAPLAVRPPLRILGIVSSPRGLPALDVEKEQDHLARALQRPRDQGRVELHWVPAATWAELHATLLDGPWHVVHFIGHGDFDAARDEGFLLLVDDHGRAHRVAAHRMVDLLRQGSPAPRLVVLNSCMSAQGSTSDLFSGTAASLVRGGISAVAAMQYEISDAAAVAFARGFYTAIAHGRGIDEALSSGRVSILGTSDTTLEWLTPVLYLRGRETSLFDVR
jgi:serine/threonine protein phosphatase PrpC